MSVTTHLQAKQKYIAKNLKFNSIVYIIEGFCGSIWNGLAVSYMLLFINWSWAQYQNIPVAKASNDILGYFQAIVSLGFLFSLFLITIFSEDAPLKKQVVIWCGGAKRITLPLFFLATWLLPPKIRFFTTFFMGFLFYFFGADGLPWRVMYAKAIPAENRGRVEGYRNVSSRAGGLFGLMVTIFIFSPASAGFFHCLAHHWPEITGIEQARYMIFFLFLSIFALFTQITVIVTREPREESSRRDWKNQLSKKLDQFKQILTCDRNFRRFQIFTVLTSCADLMIFGYAAVFVCKFLGFGENVWGELNIVTYIIGMNAMFRWGKIADECGWRKVLLKLSIYTIAVPLLFIGVAYLDLNQLHHRLGSLSFIYQSIIHSPSSLLMLILCIAFALWGIYRNTLLVARIYFPLEFNQGKMQTSYYGLTQITQQIATVIASLLVGFSIDRVGIAGVIVIGFLFQLASAVYCLSLDEPRTAQSAVMIKQE